MTDLRLDLELEKAVKAIQDNKPKLVCIQLPDGLKPRAKDIQREISEKTEAEIVFWLGSCYGACDVPLHIKKLGVDLLIQFGHSEWRPKLI